MPSSHPTHRASDASALPRVAVVGAGAVGAALAQRLAGRGYRIDAVLSRTAERARRLAERIGAGVVSAALGDLPARTTLLFCCVPDDALQTLAADLAALDRDWSGTVAAHTSGARTARVLAPLAAQGAATMSFHPVQTFTEASPPDAFEGIYVSLEGDARAMAVGRRVAADLGAQALKLPAEAKTRYHMAASVASNFFVTLMALAEEMLESAGVEADTARAVLRPLVESTWRNLEEQPARRALTGPIARGDVGTVAEHAAALTAHLPHLAPFYAAMAAETVRLAQRDGRLSGTTAAHLLDVLHTAVQSPQPDG